MYMSGEADADCAGGILSENRGCDGGNAGLGFPLPHIVGIALFVHLSEHLGDAFAPLLG